MFDWICGWCAYIGQPEIARQRRHARGVLVCPSCRGPVPAAQPRKAA